MLTVLRSNPYILAVLAGTAVSAAVAVFVWQRRAAAGATACAGLMLAAAVWSLGHALELASSDLAMKVLWKRCEYAGIVMAPVAWLAFAAQFTGRDRWLSARSLMLLVIEPLVIVLLVWTNDAHGLIWKTVALNTSAPHLPLRVSHGGAFWVHTAYSYALMLIGVLTLLLALRRSSRLYREQVVVLLLCALLPWVGNIAHLLGVGSALDVTPFAFTLTGLGTAWGLLRLQLLDLAPVARDVVIESMGDGVIVLDTQSRIVDVNPSARRIVGRSDAAIIGARAADVFSAHPNLLEYYATATEAQTEISLGPGEARHLYDLRISPLYNRRQRFIGQLVVLRDITERERALRLEASLKEKEILLKELHHRVKNNLQVISSLLSLQSGYVHDPQALEMFKESEHRVRLMAAIHAALYKSGDLAHLDANAFLRDITDNLVRSYSPNPDAIRVDVDVGKLFMDVNTAMPCGLIVNELVSNSLKHAFRDRARGEIRVQLQGNGGEPYRLRVSDNGVGLPGNCDWQRPRTLGWQLVHALTGQLGGRVEARSEPGTTEFTVTFPRQKSTAGERAGGPG